jgi:hypothetical protein
MSAAAVFSVTPDSVWLLPGERIETQCAVQADRNLPAEAKVWFWTLFTKCLRSRKWPASAETIGDECGLSRSASYRHQRLLIDAGYIERDGEMLVIVPHSCRPAPVSPVGLTSPTSGTPHTRNARAVVLETPQEKTTTPPTPEPEADDVVLSPEVKAIADALTERGVTVKEAERLARTIPVEVAWQSLAAAEDYKRTHLHEIQSFSGVCVSFLKNRWKPNKPTRPRPTPAECEPPTCWACKKPFGESEGAVDGQHRACYERGKTETN